MLWLLLSILSSTSVALLLKLASTRGLRQFPLFSVNYLTALGLGLAISEHGALAAEPPVAFVIAAASGVLYVLGFVVFRRTIHEVGTGIAASVSRLSVTGPVLISVVVFGEIIGVVQGAGIVLAILVLPLSGRVWPPWEAGATHHGAGGVLWSLALFAIFAANDIVLKVRTELLPSSDAGIFFATLFGAAAAISLAVALVRRERASAWTFLIGVPLGAVNYGTAYFLSRALEGMAGYQAFTLNNLGVMLLTVLAGRLIYGERIARHNLVFLAGSVIAIALLRLP